jgi:hypothetical protein
MTSKTNSGEHEVELDVAALTNGPVTPTLEVVGDERVAAGQSIFDNLKALEVTPTTPIGADEILSVVTVRRPKPNEFIRTSLEPKNTLTTTLFENREEGEIYLIAPHIRPFMIAGAAVRMLTLTVNQAGIPFIWPVPVDDQTVRKNAWNESARLSFHRAKTDWVKLVGDRAAGHYRIYIAKGELPAPRWPERSFQELLEIAFRNRIISSEDHPVIKSMLGLTV